MAMDGVTGEMPAIPEDTLDLGDRLDPVRTLLRRASTGDSDAAGALLDVMGPRIHGLAVHVTGSSAKAGKLTVAVLRSCLRDAAQLAASGLPGEAAVLDRARRAAVATEPSGDVRSLVAPNAVSDRTRDRREVAVMRALLDLPPIERALVESAAQGRFPYTGERRVQAATVLARLLDELVPLGDSGAPEGTAQETRALAALDALALAEDGERERLRTLTAGSEGAGVHRHAIEAAARLALLTAVPPSRDLREAVLEGFGSAPAPVRPAHQASPAPSHQGPRPAAVQAGTAPTDAGLPGRGPSAPGPEAAYRGTYATPVLGTDTQRRLVGPPAVAGMVQAGASGPAARPLPVPAPPPSAAGHPGATEPVPAFAFTRHDDANLSRRRRKQLRAQQRAAAQGARSPWPARVLGALAVLSLLGALAAGGLWLDARGDLADSRAFAATWSEMSVAEDARPVPGLSDNGTWRAVLTDDRTALWAADVAPYEEDGQDEVLQLWGERDGLPVDLGVLEPTRDGTVHVVVDEGVDRVWVTREHAPQNRSGTPSERIVANLDPDLSGT